MESPKCVLNDDGTHNEHWEKRNGVSLCRGGGTGDNEAALITYLSIYRREGDVVEG